MLHLRHFDFSISDGKMAQKQPPPAAALLLIVAVLYLAGCAGKPSTLPPAVPVFEPFSDSGSRNVPDRWWVALGDEELNARIDQALQANFNLESAWQRLRESRAVAVRASAGLYPELDAVGLAPSYEVDLWGRIDAGIEAEQFRARAAYADYQAAALTLSAEVALTWYQLLEAWSQLELIQEQIDTNRKVLRLIEIRFGAGLTRSVDVLRQRQLLEFTREQKISAESDIRVLEHRLSVLEGRAPQVPLKYTPHVLPSLPALPDAGLPAALVRRRPDVQSAFRQLQAADRELAAAVSNRYPRLTISASVSTTEDRTENLFEDWAYSIAGNLVAPLLDGGQRAAEIDRAEAFKQRRFYEYGQAVLNAFREVEDALIREKKQIQRIRSIEEQLKFSNRAYQRLQFEYLNGLGNYIDVLTALTNNQQLRRDRLSAERRLLEFRIALYRALAGGFEPDRERRMPPENRPRSAAADRNSSAKLPGELQPDSR